MRTSVACDGQVSDNPKHKQAVANDRFAQSNTTARPASKATELRTPPLPTTDYDMALRAALATKSRALRPRSRLQHLNRPHDGRQDGHVTGLMSTPPRHFSPSQGIRRNRTAFAIWVPTSAALPILPSMNRNKGPVRTM
jgi:hypothetical protein